jgi:hypothetical protein
VSFPELVAIVVDADLEALGLPAMGEGSRSLLAKLTGWHQWSAAATAIHHNGQRHVD